MYFTRLFITFMLVLCCVVILAGVLSGCTQEEPKVNVLIIWHRESTTIMPVHREDEITREI